MDRGEDQMDEASAPARRWQHGLGRAVVVALALLAVVQTVGIVAGGGSAAPPRMIGVGDDLSLLALRHGDGTVAALDPERPMLLLIFDPACVHTARVAPLWSSWLASDEARGLAVLAIAPGPLPAAETYARAQQWRTVVSSTGGPEEQAGGHPATRRTPWVVAVDSSGRVMAEGHGSEVAEVARSLLDSRWQRGRTSHSPRLTHTPGTIPRREAKEPAQCEPLP